MTGLRRNLERRGYDFDELISRKLGEFFVFNVSSFGRYYRNQICGDRAANSSRSEKVRPPAVLRRAYLVAPTARLSTRVEAAGRVADVDRPWRALVVDLYDWPADLWASSGHWGEERKGRR